MKLITLILALSFLFTSHVFAKKPAHAQNKSMKKEKTLPPGLQKKLNRGKELPPGWKKKITVGNVVSRDILQAGKEISPKEYGKQFPNTTYSKVYKIQDTLIRINKITNVVLDILKP